MEGGEFSCKFVSSLSIRCEKEIETKGSACIRLPE